MKIALKRLCIAMVACGGVIFTSPAHAGFIEFDGHYYGLTSDLLTWQEAETQAIAFGGHLAAITSQAEQDFLTANFAINEDVWIGLTDQVTEGVFLWSSTEVVTYTAFYPGEPNNLGGDEDFVNMNLGSGLWNDNNGGTRLHGIIELSTVPEPSSLALCGIAGLIGSAIARVRRKRPT